MDAASKHFCSNPCFHISSILASFRNQKSAGKGSLLGDKSLIITWYLVAWVRLSTSCHPFLLEKSKEYGAGKQQSHKQPPSVHKLLILWFLLQPPDNTTEGSTGLRLLSHTPQSYSVQSTCFSAFLFFSFFLSHCFVPKMFNWPEHIFGDCWRRWPGLENALWAGEIIQGLCSCYLQLWWVQPWT